MEFSAEMIAGLVEGIVEGDPKATVNDFAKIEHFIVLFVLTVLKHLYSLSFVKFLSRLIFNALKREKRGSRRGVSLFL